MAMDARTKEIFKLPFRVESKKRFSWSESIGRSQLWMNEQLRVNIANSKNRVDVRSLVPSGRAKSRTLAVTRVAVRSDLVRER